MRPRLRMVLAAAVAAATLAAPARAAAAKPAAPADTVPATPRSVAVEHDAHVDSLLTRALARMAGVIPGSDTLVAWDLFRAHPQRTVDLIVPTLQPVARDLWLGAPNMVWRVRVLQRLTGLEFRAPTRARLADDERLVLAPDSLRGVRFAGERRAEGKTWTAPRDAQKAIAAKWRAWWESDAMKPALPVVAHDDDRTWWY